MSAAAEPTAELAGALRENERLRRCVRDLAAVSSLPALWLGRRPAELAAPLVGMVQHLLAADLVYLRIVDPADGAAVDAGRWGAHVDPADATAEIRAALASFLAGTEADGTLSLPAGGDAAPLRITRVPIGLDADTGVLVVGARRTAFPEQSDRLLAGVIGNQLAIVLEGSRRSHEQAARVRAEADRAELQRLNDELAAANRDLRRRTAEIQTLLEVIPIGVAVAHDPDCRSITGNPAFERMLGMRRGTNLSKSAPPDEAPPFRLYRDGRELSAPDLPMQRAAASGAAVSNVEIDVVSADGTARKLLEWAAPLFDEAGRVRGSLLAVVDITQREQAEAALRESEMRLSLAARAANDVIWDWDVRTGEVVWSAALESVLGYRVPEAGRDIDEVRRWWADRIHPDDRERVTASVEAALGGADEVWSGEYRFRRADGSFAHVVDRAYVARDGQGRPRRVVGSMLDITARVRAEEEQRFLAEASAVLASSLDYEHTLATVARLAVFALADWCLVDVTEPDRSVRKLAVAHADAASEPLASELRGYAPDLGRPHPVSDVFRTGQPTLLGQVTDAWLASHARDERHLALLRRLGPRSAMIVPLKARGQILGAVTFFSTRADRVYGRADLAFAENLASRAAIAVDNARLYQEAQAATRAREAFLARASHELRTPLTSALGAMRLVKRAMSGAFAERPDALIDLANRNLDAMLSLVNALLDASKLGAEGERLEAAPVTLARLLARSLEQVEPQARERAVTIAMSVPPALAVLGDSEKLEQVFVNLLVNAVRHSHTGGTVRLDAEGNAEGVLVRVADRGEGIAGEDLERIFEPFVQAHRRDRRGVRGTGLGLAICRQIVTLHGGRIWAESAGPGHGSTFVVELPRAAEREDAA